ncbi:MAG: hypothetical protein PHV07_03550 [Oscillospiraceae bacterium]|nr:hypothetical protein [Oscillospiraceae bacterium]
MDENVKIKSNMIRAILFMVVLLVSGIYGIYQFFFVTAEIWMLILGIVFLCSSVFAIFMCDLYIVIGENELTIKLFKIQTVKADEISQIDWTFFSQRKGYCYVNLKDGKSRALSRVTFEKKLKNELIKFAERNGISQRGLDK